MNASFILSFSSLSGMGNKFNQNKKVRSFKLLTFLLYNYSFVYFFLLSGFPFLASWLAFMASSKRI